MLLSRWTFRSLEEYEQHETRHHDLRVQIWLWHETLGNSAEPVSQLGICELCCCQTTFRTDTRRADAGSPFDYQADWRMSCACNCGMRALDRSIARLQRDDGHALDCLYHVGHLHCPLREWFAARMPNLVSSQYVAGVPSGTVVDGIRIEDLTSLSFVSEKFDALVAAEVLEHIPNYKDALREMARVLKPGGRAMLTFPWRGGRYYERVTRADVLADGSIYHFMPPEYHIDPEHPAGVLCFRVFGWEILDDLRLAGFSDASVTFLFEPLHGYMTILNPVIIGIR